jgi:hypothetical protein
MKKFNQFINENLTADQVINTRDADVVFNFIKSMPIKYKLSVKYVIRQKLFEDGFKTAINNSTIVNFYFEYLKKQHKTSTVINIPDNIDYSVYDKLQELILLCLKYTANRDIHDYYDNTKGFLEQSELYHWLMDMNLLIASCYQMMHILLYEDYFGNIFKQNGHNIVKNIILPKNESELKELFKIFNDNRGEIRSLLFFADCVNIVGLIERYE